MTTTPQSTLVIGKHLTFDLSVLDSGDRTSLTCEAIVHLVPSALASRQTAGSFDGSPKALCSLDQLLLRSACPVPRLIPRVRVVARRVVHATAPSSAARAAREPDAGTKPAPVNVTPYPLIACLLLHMRVSIPGWSIRRTTPLATDTALFAARPRPIEDRHVRDLTIHMRSTSRAVKRYKDPGLQERMAANKCSGTLTEAQLCEISPDQRRRGNRSPARPRGEVGQLSVRVRATAVETETAAIASRRYT